MRKSRKQREEEKTVDSQEGSWLVGCLVGCLVTLVCLMTEREKLNYLKRECLEKIKKIGNKGRRRSIT